MNPIIYAMAYNLALLGGTVYLVGWHGWSPWWFALTLLILAGSKDVK